MKKQIEKESDIVSAICTYLSFRNVFFFRLNNIPVWTGERFRAMPKWTPKGLPDLVIIRKGQFIGMEVKRHGNKQSPDQKDIEARIMKAGGHYFLVHSVEELQKYGI